MALHPRLRELFETLDIDDAQAAPDQATWARLLVGINQICAESEHNAFLLNQTLDTLGESSRQLEFKVNEEREKLQSLLSAVEDGVCAIDRRGRLLFANPAAFRLFDHALGDDFRLLEHLGVDRTDPDQPDLDPERSAQALLNSGAILRDDDGLLERNGAGALPVSYILSPIDRDGVIVGAVCVIRDVTEQKEVADRLQRLNDEITRARDQAIEANQAKSSFLANMSHELRTPLNAVIGYTELIREDAEVFGYNEITPDLGKIYTAAKHLLSLINDILDLSKIEAGRHEIVWESFDLGELIADVISTIEPVAREKNNHFDVQAEADLGMIRADRIKLRQILINLLSNACKFTENGRITLSVRREDTGPGEHFIFDVTDTGIGVVQEKIDELFEPFTQADNSTTRQYGGTGLGLTITQHFCRMMGGFIDATSRPGEGSTFSVHLPAPLVASETLNAIDEAAALPRAARNDHTVLVIDDSETVHELLRRQLGRAGYRVVSAISGDEGLRMARAVGPSAITLDVMMPGRSGWDTLAELKHDPELAHIPVVMLTMVVDRKKGFALGADDYLVKPVSGDVLLRTLQRFELERGELQALVVEDDDATREIMDRTLKNAGWQTTTAIHGRKAIDHLRALDPGNLPDIILLDLMMPEMDGFEFLEVLRADATLSDIPVIVVTARQLSRKELQQLQQVTERVMRKGNFTGAELVEEVDRLVAPGTRRPLAPALS
ncbi:response regulator [Lujinxingia vulgaris]|uniref:histidine kinase n=1 Tax=Lujinxingia vulgaris TaxID=2600176 RepID=A0A5C6XEF7_9DELT|nr:response regulator [Lujinxingia vulgaris]TXD42681.1 response regulator [Lujinxingia vulgaris]